MAEIHSIAVGKTDKDPGTNRDHQQKIGQHVDESEKIKALNRRRSSSSVTTVHHTQPPPLDSGFLIRPTLQDKFDRRKVESSMEQVIREFMGDKPIYCPNEASDWSEQLTQLVNTKVKELNFPRYKICTLITIGEQIGGGIHIGMKCLWDADTDLYANYSYMTDTMFVVGTVCGIFYY